MSAEVADGRFSKIRDATPDELAVNNAIYPDHVRINIATF
jgi:hypothetical protein